jgi:hypothetical protein
LIFVFLVNARDARAFVVYVAVTQLSHRRGQRSPDS